MYYCSLHHGHVRAAFIHVPASGSMATPDRLVPLLQTVIQAMLKQLEALQTAKDHMTTVSKTPEDPTMATSGIVHTGDDP